MFAGQKGNKKQQQQRNKKKHLFPFVRNRAHKGSRPNPLDFDFEQDCTHATGTLIKCLRVFEDGPWEIEQFK